jgi:hypothetical protein
MDTLFTTLILIAASLFYFIPTLIPYIILPSAIKTTQGLAPISLFFAPYVGYALLEFVEERQGFNLPLGFFLCGISPGIILLICRFKPFNVVYMSLGVVISLIAVLLIWMFTPTSGLNRMM